MVTVAENLRFYHSVNKDFILRSNTGDPSLSVLDQESGQESLAQPAEKCVAVWETCQRKICFFESEDLSLQTSESKFLNPSAYPELYAGAQALEFLLSLLCGLDSKMVGETEVFGQFKNFLQTPEAQKVSFFQNKRFIQFLFQEVKSIRDRHLTGLGVHSYGSLIRKLSKDLDHVSILGYGHLAQEVIPWFKNKQINIQVRNPQRFSGQDQAGTDSVIQFQELGSAPLASLVVIAAPLSSVALNQLFLSCGQNITQVIDCRALGQEQTSLQNGSQAGSKSGSKNGGSYSVVELKDLFDLLSGQQEKIHQAIPAIRSEIAMRVQGCLLKAHHRPLGWDDLC